MDTTIEIRPRSAFRAFLESDKRWDCLVVHRRGGKTFASLQKLLKRALTHKRPGPPCKYAYIAPTRDQAKDIAWGYLKRFTWQIPGVVVNESELKITFPGGASIRLYSGDSYERLRGTYLDGVIIDEPEDIAADAWPAVIRPCLADYTGWAIWIGTIKGKEGHWQRYLAAKESDNWFSMLLKASESGIIPAAELADIKSSTHPDIYAQEYECDTKVSRCAFTSASMDFQDEMAKLVTPEYGYLTYRDRIGTHWSPSSEDGAMIVRYEQPLHGRRYLVSVDSAAGIDQTGGQDPDSHSILVHRAGYIAAESGKWIPPALVARNIMVRGNKPGSMCCWWTESVLEDQVHMLCDYYGAFLVPEENYDKGLIEAMRERGVSIYKRETFNEVDSTIKKCFGWRTTPKTRPRIIAKLESTMRETVEGEVGTGYHVRCPWILSQMRNFGTKPNGRMEAMSGKDDDVISLAIGNFMIDSALTYHEDTVERHIPRELRRALDARSQPGKGRSTFS